MNKLYQPYLNPIKFHLINPTVIPQYVSKHMDDYAYYKTIADHEEKTGWVQPWQKNDPIRLQMESNYGTLPIKLFRCSDGAEIYSTQFVNLIQNFFDPAFYIRQLDFDMNVFPSDIYYFVMDNKYISEFIETKEIQPGTLFCEYTHHERRGGLRFDIPNNNFKPGIRIPGRLKLNDTGSEDIIYEDDPLNETMIESKPFRVWDWFVGNSGSGDQTPGVPPWFIDKVKRIAGCSSLKLDGRLYTKMKDGKWENFVEDGTLMIGAKHEMRDKLNRESLIYEDDVLIPGIAAAGLITDTKGFGMGDNSGDDYLELGFVQ